MSAQCLLTLHQDRPPAGCLADNGGVGERLRKGEYGDLFTADPEVERAATRRHDTKHAYQGPPGGQRCALMPTFEACRGPHSHAQSRMIHIREYARQVTRPRLSAVPFRGPEPELSSDGSCGSTIRLAPVARDVPVWRSSYGTIRPGVPRDRDAPSDRCARPPGGPTKTHKRSSRPSLC